ncbi:hypothetical protein GQ600_18195 [Phytophthora cactorum]|nr:hypothetical protein GQ600_18195 [Phytophthora cactorum]
MLAVAVVWSLLPLLVVAQDDQVSYSVSLSTGTLIGIVAGCVVVLLVLICCCCCMSKRRKAKRQRELEAAVAAAIVNTPKADDSHAIDVPYEQHLQHNTGSTYTSSTTHPRRSGTLPSCQFMHKFSTKQQDYNSRRATPRCHDRHELYRNRAAVATRADPSRAADGVTATPALEPLEVSSAALEALAAESVVVEADSLDGAWVSMVRSLPESESPTVTSSFELAEDVVLVVGATVTSSVLSREAEDVLATALAEPAEAEADVAEAAVDADAEVFEPAEVVVDELELPEQEVAKGVMRSA